MDKISRKLLSMLVTTIRVMSRADAFVAKGRVFQHMTMGLMGAS
jgi:hypothetical protein